jgi:hypothetical protein
MASPEVNRLFVRRKKRRAAIELSADVTSIEVIFESDLI